MPSARLSMIRAIVALPFILCPLAAAERSMVGRKLPDVVFQDTEGHAINPRHYEGSVFVMLTGIPW